MAQKERFERFTAHFSEEIPDELEAFTTNEVLIRSRYLFVRRKGPFQYGFCTHCQKEALVKSDKALLHNDDWACGNCKSLVQVKSAGRGRSKLVDEAYVIWYSKSKCSANAMIATAYRVRRDYSGEYTGVRTAYAAVARYLFEPGKATMMRRSAYYSGFFYNRRVHYEDGWEFAKEVRSHIHKIMHIYPCSQSIESIHAAVKDTTFQYSTWEQYLKNEDMVEFFALYAKYPCVEYLTKMGHKNLVEEKLDRRPSWHAINWNGRTPEKVLGLSRQEIKAMRSASLRKKITHQVMATYKWFRKRGVSISFEQAESYGSLCTVEHYTKKMNRLLEHMTLETMIRYMNNQMAKELKKHGDGTSFIQIWNDYLDECIELGMDIQQEKVLFPNNLYAAHQKNIRTLKIKADEKINAKIEKRVSSLQKFCFSQNGLIIRPAMSSIELFDEGKALDHCVGRYADKYAEGDSNLFFIRRESDPETPFYTMEVSCKENMVVQCRGKANCKMTEEVEEFVQAFESMKLGKQKVIKPSVNRPADRQEVAV